MKTVNFYRPKNHKGPLSQNELHSLCNECAKNRKDIELIDAAGDWDECEECEVQNVPYKTGEYPNG